MRLLKLSIMVYYNLPLITFIPRSFPQNPKILHNFTLPESPCRNNILFHYCYLVITTYPHLMPKGQSLLTVTFGYLFNLGVTLKSHMVFCLFWWSSTREVQHFCKWCSSNIDSHKLCYCTNQKVFCEQMHLKNAKVKQSQYCNCSVIKW